MPASQSKFLLFLIAGIVSSALIGIYAWNNPRTRGRRAFVGGIVASCLWMMGSLIGRWSATLEWQYFAEIVRYAGIMPLPVLMFAFSRQYCGKPVEWRVLRWVFALPFFSYVVMATSWWHPLFYAHFERGSPQTPGFDGLINVYGPYFWWVHLPYSYGLTLLSLILIVSEIGRVPRAFRGQIIYLFISFCVPLAINAAGLSGLLRYNLTAFSIPAFSILIACAMFRHEFLGVNPIAYESIVQNIRDGVIIVDRNGIVADINCAAAQIVNLERSEIVGKSLDQVFGGWEKLLNNYRVDTDLSLEIARAVDGEARFFTLDVVVLHGINRQIDGRTLTLRDVTDAKSYQQSLELLAFYDPLTRLANRRKFGEEVDRLLQLAARQQLEFAILYFDLNRFKAVNDTLGHEFGDELLRAVGERAVEELRSPDFIARLGGDEFVILLHNTAPADIETVTARLVERIEQPLRVRGELLLPNLSLGAAFYPRDGTDLQTLLRHSDAQMYRAKENGGGLSFDVAAGEAEGEGEGEL